jgi:two-component sensor histidine kinase
MVIHEMITNSAKYGALSDNRGRVEIATALDALGASRSSGPSRAGLR